MEKTDHIAFTAGFADAVIVLHEIYGVTAHILSVCADLHGAGYDVLCPKLYGGAEPFSYGREREAYDFFMKNVGFGAFSFVNALAADCCGEYKRVFFVGFSAGATLAWRCAASGTYSGAVCFYGSRIRDYARETPRCPTLAIFARDEASFSPDAVRAAFPQTINPGAASPGAAFVETAIMDAGHGFCDPHAKTFNPRAARRAKKRAMIFLEQLRAARF